MNDAAGRTTSNQIPLSKSGAYLGASIVKTFSENNDNSDAIGALTLRNGDNTVLVFGEVISSVVVTSNKELGTDGNGTFTVDILVFLRSSGH